MRRIAVLSLLLASIASASFSQSGYLVIGIYADDGYGGYTYVLRDEGPPHECMVYVLQEGQSGTMSEFRVDDSQSVLVRVGTEFHTPVHIGDPFTGISLGYGTCATPPILLMTLTYLCEGNSPPSCSSISIASHLDSPVDAVLVADCTLPSPNIRYAAPGKLWINQGWCPTPVEPTTWGQIKALYE